MARRDSPCRKFNVLLDTDRHRSCDSKNDGPAYNKSGIDDRQVKQRCKGYDQSVSDILKDTNHIIPHGDNIVLQDWNDFPIKNDPDFVDKFQNVVSDE